MKSKFILAMILAISVPDALASEQGFYAAFDGGLSRISGLCNIFPSGVNCHDIGKVIRLTGGYQFSATWGVELAYVHLAEVGAEGVITTISPSGSAISAPYSGLVRIRGPMLTGLATIPLGNGWSVITKGGSLRLTNLNVLVETPNGNGGFSHIGYTSLSLFWGIGAQYDFTNSYSVRAQYEDFGTLGNTATGKFAVKALTVGLAYKFY